MQLEPVGLEKRAPEALFALPLRMEKVAQYSLSVPEYCRIRREYHVGKTNLGLDVVQFNSEPKIGPLERQPLLSGQRLTHRHIDMHPGIDLVFDAEVVGPAHEEAH